MTYLGFRASPPNLSVNDRGQVAYRLKHPFGDGTTHVAHVPEGREVFPLLTVAENLAMGAWTRADDGADGGLRMVIDYFPVLKERLHQAAGTLSGGRQQMLAIARALVARPRIMLLVERNATAALDVADSGYVTELGRIVMDGPAERLQQSRDIQDFYLGEPERSHHAERCRKRPETLAMVRYRYGAHTWTEMHRGLEHGRVPTRWRLGTRSQPPSAARVIATVPTVRGRLPRLQTRGRRSRFCARQSRTICPPACRTGPSTTP